MNKKYLPYAAIVIAVGILAAVLWPEDAPPPAPAPAPVPQTAPKPPVVPKTEEKQEEKNSMRVSFINHLGDAHVNFHVDGKFICAANAGKACNGEVPFGKHVVQALEGDKVIRTLELTLHEDTENPTVVVCFPTSPNC